MNRTLQIFFIRANFGNNAGPVTIAEVAHRQKSFRGDATCRAITVDDA